MADHFLLKTSHPSDRYLPFGDVLAIDAHARLTDVLHSRIGLEAARLFAEPFVSHDKSSQTIHVAWYGPQGAEARQMSDLDPASRRLAEDRLHVLIPRIEALAAEPALAALIRASLTLTAATDILTIDGMPVLVNWGITRPSGENPLGGYLRAAAPESATAPLARPLIETPPPHAALTLSRPPEWLPRIAWVPLVVLLALTALTLAWVLWPGNRIFADASAGLITPEAVDGASRAEVDSLRTRRATLEAALKGAQCRQDGRLVLPGNISPEGLSIPAPGVPALTEPTTVAPDAPVAPAPDRVSVPGGAGDASQSSTLLAQVEASTVLVLASGPDGLSTGSGFVIAPGLIVTNRHVIEGAKPDAVYVTNAALGKAVPAKILKSEGPFDENGRDFALMQIAVTTLPALALADPAATQKLHHVVATGFPGDVMETDANFDRLIAGDASAIPELVVVDGTVNTRQDMPPDAKVLVHSAPLSSGNSGGPLVDFCGRVLGVNTFVRQGPMRTLNFAVATATLARFLAGTPGEVAIQTSDCAPNVLPVPQATAAATPHEAVPEAALVAP